MQFQIIPLRDWNIILGNEGFNVGIAISNNPFKGLKPRCNPGKGPCGWLQFQIIPLRDWNQEYLDDETTIVLQFQIIPLRDWNASAIKPIKAFANCNFK